MKNHGISNGLILGGVSVAITLIFYVISPDLFFNWWLQMLLGLAINIFFISRAGLMTRRDLNGFITFSQAIKPTFTTVAIGMLITSLFNFVLYNYIDPDLAITLKERTLEMSENMMKSFGASDAQIEEAMAKVEDQNFMPTIGKTIQQYLMGLLVGFVAAAIVSLIIKRNPPVTVNEV